MAYKVFIRRHRNMALQSLEINQKLLENENAKLDAYRNIGEERLI